jgi:hypothetical protein
MPGYALERDANHAELETAARQMGAFVVDSSSFSQYHKGFPDNIWALWWIGQTWLAEFKVGDAQLSEAQEEFREKWLEAGGVHVTVRSVDDVERLLRR